VGGSPGNDKLSSPVMFVESVGGQDSGAYFLPKDYGGEGVDPKASKIEHAIRAFRERVDGSPRHGYSRTFVETRTWFQVQEACATAINENAIVVIVGKPGVGKTRSLIEYAARKMSTAPLSILCSPNITTHYFVQRLAQELKLDDRGTTSKLEDRVIEKLRRYRVRCLWTKRIT
jgi:DNA transposition AAA+ family ATPase